MAAEVDDTIRLTIDGREYSLDPDDLELGEVELLEDELDASLDSIDFTRAKAMRVLVYLLVHRDNPKFTMEDAARLKLSALGDPDPAPVAGAKKRPTKAAASRV